MILTGKCKEDFENWFEYNTNKELNLTIIDDYYTYPISMQFGVIQNFADSKGIYIEIQVHTSPTMQGGNFNGFKPCILFKGIFINIPLKSKKRSLAIEQAIIKFNELYNKQLRKLKN